MKPSGYEAIKILYDFYCPSVQEKLREKDGSRYTCSDCKDIFTTIALAQRHKKLFKHTAQLEIDDDIVFDTDSGDTTTVHDDQAYIIEDMAEFMPVH